MKAGWKLQRLGDLCAFDKSQGIHPNLPYVGLEHIESDTGQYLGSLEPTDVKSSTFKFNDSHVLYGRLRPYLNKVLLPDFEGHCSTEIFPIQIKPGLLREYLGHWLMSESVVESINTTCTGARMPRADMNAVLEFNIPVPSEQEQRRIVTLLDEAFADIATAKANAEKNLQNATSIFENHLQATFSTDGASWERKTLGDVFTTATGTTPPKSNASFYGDFIPLVKPPELLDDVIESAPDSLTESGAKAARVLPALSVLVSCIGNLGKIGINTVPVCFNQQINAILPNEGKALPDFMFFQALSPVFKKQLEGLASGTTVPIVNKSKFNSIQIALPPLDQQVNIVGQLKALSEETKVLEAIYRQKLTALDDLKKSLLHQAFSGQL